MAFAKKELTCPGCRGSLRVPVKQNKILRITCPRCGHQFDIQFTNPLKEIFSFDQGKSFGDNLKTMWQKFQSLPGRAKFVLVAFVVSIALLVSSLLNLLFYPGHRPLPRETIPLEEGTPLPENGKNTPGLLDI